MGDGVVLMVGATAQVLCEMYLCNLISHAGKTKRYLLSG